MKVLDADESWKLFLRKVFVDNTNCGCPKELKNIAEEILEKCGGLPLAISVVGGLLATKPKREREWKKVVKEMKSHLDRRIRGDIDTISAILELSYQNLPPELKACFLCFGFFKEDASIEVEYLEHIWVALGLVAQGEEKTMEDVAREYLDELIDRNMVQVKEMENDRVKFCQMHDLLRDLSIKKAKEEIYLEVVSEEGNSHQSLDKPRHRAIHFRRSSFLNSTSRNQHLRSLFTLDNVGDMMWLPCDFPPNLSHLTLSSISLTKDPMPVLAKLSKLLYLKLTHEAYRGETMAISSVGFPRLKVLHLEHMFQFRNMRIEEGAMPELNQFIIHECPNLKRDHLPKYFESAITDADEL